MNNIMEYTTKPGTTLMFSIITACAWCNRIRINGTDARRQTSWVDQNFVKIENETLVSHSICPACSTRVKEELKAS